MTILDRVSGPGHVYNCLSACRWCCSCGDAGALRALNPLKSQAAQASQGIVHRCICRALAQSAQSVSSLLKSVNQSNSGRSSDPQVKIRFQNWILQTILHPLGQETPAPLPLTNRQAACNKLCRYMCLNLIRFQQEYQPSVTKKEGNERIPSSEDKRARPQSDVPLCLVLPGHSPHRLLSPQNELLLLV